MLRIRDQHGPEDEFEILLAPDRRLRAAAFPARPDPYPERAVIDVGDVRMAAPLDALIDSARSRLELGDRRRRLAYDWLRWDRRISTGRASRRLAELAGSDPGG